MKRLCRRACLAMYCSLIPLSLPANVEVETATLALVFNDQGSLVQVTVCFPLCSQENAKRLKLEHVDGLVTFGQSREATWVQRRGLAAEQAGKAQRLHFTSSDGQTISWNFPANGYLIDVAVDGADRLVMRSGDGFRPRPAAGFGAWLERLRYIAVGPDGVRQFERDDEEFGHFAARWAGFRNRFWTLMVNGRAGAPFEAHTGDANGTATIQTSAQLDREQFIIYLGPVEPGELARVDTDLGNIPYSGLWFWVRWISLGLNHLLGWIHSVIPSWGVAILLLSLTVHILMLPLSRVAERLQHEVNATESRLAPELSRIRKDFRGELQAASIIALYKSERVHPMYSLKSLLGVAVVIPVFIGAFDMLAENIHLLQAGFLWIKDLSRPDAWMSLPFGLPFFGSQVNLLPFLMTGLSVVATLLHRPLSLTGELRRRQVRNMLLLALAFFALFYTFPAGMVLYWTTNNLISVGKGLWERMQPGQVK